MPFADFLVRSDDLAVIVAGLVAFPAGFTFNVIAISRLDPPGEPMSMGLHGPMIRSQNLDDLFRLGIGFSDGTKVTTYGRMRPPRQGRTEAERTLHQRGGGGGGRRWGQGYWCEPLPPAGPMRFVCRWLAQGVEEAALEFDAGLILDAAARAVAIWPEDKDLPEDESGRVRWPGAAWRG
ncbi:MAG: hypothetical protein ACRD0Z_11270, partial [Acidimicrobiales bacterium]